ncbi:c-type cytochrome [Mesorhizobium kowhaii]|uniref:Cytochrome C554 n=1 Tax=Mesorhizobium kowhaii TaxID=1300272 RepID=A0A2W7BRV3_9HYPH|nr:cytochrome c [Mesorhizobium kowhaii]PZV33362.1 cytochrome C554 [Mesorhizobium kowhaii]
MHSLRVVILLAGIVVTSSFAQAAGDSIAGQKVIVKCQGCHGKDGLGRALPGGGEAPNIAGQKYDYLVHSLMAYKARERKSSMMSLVVKNLSDEDIANVAAYYAAIKITVEAPQ